MVVRTKTIQIESKGESVFVSGSTAAVTTIEYEPSQI